MALVFLPIGQGLIQFIGAWLGNYTAASLLAAAIVTVPNFLANKHFVWRVTSDEKLREQVVIFWIVVMLAVSLATFSTYLVDHALVDKTTAIRATAVFVVQVLGFGVVWIGRFFILDRWFFNLAKEAEDASPRARPDLAGLGLLRRLAPAMLDTSEPMVVRTAARS
ncbi:hypothetical protein A5764_06650 [Mycobacterium sp. 852002-51057_SCH5723018]|nr:hypothetical protein A5764_06650 [Mycobacterium sp. 852002-51057_SCH5723018]